MSFSRIVLVLACAPLLLLSTALTGEREAFERGRIDFPTSASGDAQRLFLKGMLLLHHGLTDEAREAFREAQGLDPDFAMAFWGEAMSYADYWGLDLEAGRAALNRLAPDPASRLEKAPTQREKQYLRAVDILYGDADEMEKKAAYVEAMRGLARDYPDDLEAAVFHGHAIFRTSEPRRARDERDFAILMKAAAVLEGVFLRNQAHPGAARLLLVCYDDRVHAPLGLRPARVYRQIGPASEQHLPSHIFLRLGSWDEVAMANEACWTAVRKNFHCLEWLQYAYLQQGRYRKARQLLTFLQEEAARSPSRYARSHLIHLRGHYLAETEQWNALPATAVDLSELSLHAVFTHLWMNGLSALKRGDPALAETTLREMRERPASGSGSSFAKTLQKQLEAQLELGKGNSRKAVEILEEAAQFEKQQISRGEPRWGLFVKPSHEMLGEVLLRLERPEEARRHFALALAEAPRRALSLLGLARSAALTGEQAAARRAYRELGEIWSEADPELPHLKEVLRGSEHTQRTRR